MWHHPDFALLDYSTLPPLLLLPRLPLGSLRSQIFFSPTPFFSPFSPNAEPGPRLLGFRLVILQNCSKFFCYNLLASSSHSQCPPYLIYTFQGRREEVKKYRCAFPLLSKLLSFRYIFEKRHTLNSLLTDTSIRQTAGVGSCRFLLFFCIYTLSGHTPFKTDNRHFWNRQRTLKKCSIEWKYVKNTSKQYTINCLVYYFADSILWRF